MSLNKEFLENFKERLGLDPIFSENKEIIIIKLFKKIRMTEEELKDNAETKSIYKTVEKDTNPKFLILSKKDGIDYDLYLKKKTLSLTKNFSRYIKVKDLLNNETLNLTEIKETKYFLNAPHIKETDYNNFLRHISMKDTISKKLVNIIDDKFSTTQKKKSPTTNFVLANLGYIIKGSEGKYLELSVRDRTFLKNFVNFQALNNYFDFTILEAFPMFKENISDVIKKGEQLLLLEDKKKSISSFSKRELGTERKTLESCWQFYFEKYLKIFFMGYKDFYNQVVFDVAEGYDKESRPDFLAVDIYNNVDIVEIKHHRTTLFRKEDGRDSYYPSAELNKSIFQLNKYLDLDTNLIKSKKITNKMSKLLFDKSERIYRPRGILIISSKEHLISEDVSDDVYIRLEREIRKLKTTYKNIDIILFDELIESLKNYLQFMEITFKDNKPKLIDDEF